MVGGPRTTVVVATYNQPRELALVLAALAAQTDGAFDVVVADDGSSPTAEQSLATLRLSLPFALRCVRQEDDGFRKAAIQNTAALSTEAELLVFLDGDCVPFRDLVAAYRAAYEPGQFLVGAVVYLDEEASARLDAERVRAGAHERAVGFGERLRLFGVHAKNRLYTGRKQTRPRIKGGNFAVAADLFAAVDGFDEVYGGFGKEDSDLRNRMRNAGAAGRSLWLSARACHLARPSDRPAGRSVPPKELYEEGRRRVTARVGLRSHGAGAPAVAGTAADARAPMEQEARGG